MPCGMVGIKISCDDIIGIVKELIELGYGAGVIYYCGVGYRRKVTVCYV